MLNARSASSDATANANAARRLARASARRAATSSSSGPTTRRRGRAKSGVVAGVAAGEIRRVALGCQPFGTVLAERLQQPEGGWVSQVCHNHGLVDQRRHDVDDIVAEWRPGGDRVGGGHVEASGEDGEPPERRSFVVVEQPPAPVERGAQRLVPLDSPVASGGEDIQVLIESRCELG